MVEWCGPRAGLRVVDVATGGGHVARRLREAGAEVVTVDPSPAMQPDVIASAESLPFADRSFDVVVNRLAAHHFTSIADAVREFARVTNELVVIEDHRYTDEQTEEAERLRDPSHGVRSPRPSGASCSPASGSRSSGSSTSTWSSSSRAGSRARRRPTRTLRVRELLAPLTSRTVACGSPR